MRLAEVDYIEQALLCRRTTYRVAAVWSSATHTPSLLNVGASQNMPLFDTHLHPGSWCRLRRSLKAS
ncbi:hypothetical protein M3J09_013068 [Ascochyta lentis]